MYIWALFHPLLQKHKKTALFFPLFIRLVLCQKKEEATLSILFSFFGSKGGVGHRENKFHCVFLHASAAGVSLWDRVVAVCIHHGVALWGKDSQ